MQTRFLLPALLLAAALLSPRSAGAAASPEFARNFAEGVRLFKEMDWERSLEKFELARKQPHGAAEEVQALLYAGILQFELGKEAESNQMFSIAASLDPRAALPVKVSPRIEIAYEKQRAKFAALMTHVAAPQVVQPLPPAHPQPAPVAPPAPSPVMVPVPVQPAPPALAVAPPAAVAVAAPPPAVSTKKTADDGPRPKKVAGGVVLGVGAAAAVVGGISYGLAWSKYPKYEANQATRAETEEMDVDFKAGLGCLIGGAAVAVVGVVLLALPDGTSATASLAPVPGGAAFAVSGTLP